jgi:hypothetical protein
MKAGRMTFSFASGRIGKTTQDQPSKSCFKVHHHLVILQPPKSSSCRILYD